MTALQEKLLKLRQVRSECRDLFAKYKDDLSKMPSYVTEQITARTKEIQKLEDETKALEALEVQARENEEALKRFEHPTDDGREYEGKTREGVDFKSSVKYKSEAQRILKEGRRFKSLSNFRNDEKGIVSAYRFAKWFAATLLHDVSTVPTEFCRKARAYCQEFGIEVKAHSESVNTAGGYLVPPEFATEIIDLRERYGVFRQYARVVPMMSDTKNIPRRNSGLTVYNPGEGIGATESQKAWSNVNLVAKKFACLALYSSELDEDAMINMGDDLAGEIAYAFANKEDECGFNGDGTSTYFGITGVRSALTNLSGTIANIAGVFVGAGNAYSELTLADFNNVSGLLPAYAETARTAWFVSKKFWGSVMEKLATAAGGVTAADVVNGAPNRRFLGYPVVISQVMPRTEANSQVCALFGDLSLAATFGDRRQLTLAVSSEYKFAEDQLAIKGTQRIDINVHDVGNASATAALQVPGPIVGLITAAS